MLQWIHIRNIAVIDEVEVSFEAGLNLLTGETGAGKSILVDALGLILGERASSELLRTGAESAWVEASFEMGATSQGIVKILEDAGIEHAGPEVVIRREVSSSGRGRVAVNGAATVSSVLKSLAPYLADIHGQGQAASLLVPDAGLHVLDAHVDRGARQEVEAAHARLAALERELAEIQRESRDRESTRELLRFKLQEIERAGARPGEDAELETERRLLAHAEKLREMAEEAYGLLYEREASVLSQLSQARKRLFDLAAIDPRFESYALSQDAIRSQLEDVALFLRDYRTQVPSEPGRLNEVEARLSELARLKKKYGSLEAALAEGETARKRLQTLEGASERLAQIQEERPLLVEAYRERARVLSELRTNAARKLEAEVERELKELAMERARFVVRVESAREETGRGVDAVELLFSANQGEEPRPLHRIASGGELSRFMLALKSAEAREESARTLIFDEVDAGIGGRVAEVVGSKLKALSRRNQVICVTHLPQIASFADAHYRITKKESKGRTVMRIDHLDRAGRVDEIARMLAGATITETARKHAEQLVTDKS